MGAMVRLVRVAVVAALAVALSGCLRLDVYLLSHDDMGGRQNGTDGSLLAQEYLLGYLRAWTVGPFDGDGDDAYRQSFTDGTNLVGIVPGTTRADEYVLVGGHYDHLSTCRLSTAEDSICNGATDNATGTAVVVDVLRAIALGRTPERSVIFAFWDREEDGLLGSAAYAADPPVPLDDVVAYVNFDIQGANLRPSGRTTTFAVGAETGGPVLIDAVERAAAPSTLDTRLLSLIFGLGRSDHAVFAARNVPVVFFTDSTGPCYHSVHDDFGVVDLDKLDQQSATARRTVRDLANGPERPTFATGLPLATFDDFLSVHQLLERMIAEDLDTFPTSDAATLVEKFEVDRKSVV